jgi:general secretion pathway protein F
VPIYTYKGYDAASGAARKGKIEADSPKTARARLRQKDKVIVSELKEEASLEKVKAKNSLFAGRVKVGDVAVMSRQFATLANAHVPLDESLRALTDQVENVVLRNTLSAVREQVSEGKSLGEATSQFPGVFNRLYVNMVRAGEQSGTLGLVMDRLADYLEKQVEARGQVVSAMTYPAVMMLANVGLIGYLIMSLVPKLQKVFISLKAPLPWYTQQIINLSELLQSKVFWVVFLSIAAGAFYAFRSWVSTPKGRMIFDELLLKLPVFGQLILRMQVSRFTQTLSTLLASGVPIIRALEITKNIISNAVISEVLENAKTSVQEGKSLGITIEKSGRFPPLVTHMIMTGERTGQLEEMLSHVATAYEAEVQRKIEALISLVEPVMIVFMAGSAGGIIAAVLVPMLSIMNQIR